MTVDELIIENARRHKAWAAEDERLKRFASDTPFVLWAKKHVKIRHKITGQIIEFTLNRPQLHLLEVLERQRRAGVPMRIIMLKARQWGGSTLVIFYMAWIQMTLRKNWHSLVCAHNKNTSCTIRGMVANMLESYSDSNFSDDEKVQFRPYQHSSLTRIISTRDCCVTVSSANCPDATRGLDASMAHLSEVAYWPESDKQSGERLALNICSGIPMQPDTLIVMESTANGVGNFFHKQWLRAEARESAYVPVFIPWYDIEMYNKEVDDPMVLWSSLTPYERKLWESSKVTLEQLAWYHEMSRNITSPELMQAEFPSFPSEAFIGTSSQVFDGAQIENLRKGCAPPVHVGEVVGDSPSGPKALLNVRFAPSPKGMLKVWHLPERPSSGSKYVVTVDVGGRTAQADWSVIAVLRRSYNNPPEVVAQWRGHIDHDLLAWKAAAIARFYNEALLVVESNSYEGGTDNAAFLLENLNRYYYNMYYRTAFDHYTQAEESRVGFHTNRYTKPLAIHTLIGFIRDRQYIERDQEACNEFSCYESNKSGIFSARRGCHDDILMTRAIGLYVISTLPAITPPIT